MPEEERLLIARSPSTNRPFHRSSLGLPREIQRVLADTLLAAPLPPDDPEATIFATSAAVLPTLTWILDEPLAASSRALALPEGEPRRWALRHLPASWRDVGHEGVEAWIDSLPEADREDLAGWSGWAGR